MSTLRLYKAPLYKHARPIHITNHFFLLTCFFFAGVLRALDLFRLRALGAKADSAPTLLDAMVRCDFLSVTFTTPTLLLTFRFLFPLFPSFSPTLGFQGLQSTQNHEDTRKKPRGHTQKTMRTHSHNHEERHTWIHCSLSESHIHSRSSSRKGKGTREVLAPQRMPHQHWE